MARPATALTVRIKRLQEALARAVANSEPGTVLSFEPMHKLIGVSRKSLLEWCRDIEGFDTSGCFNAGAEGMKYEFNPVATLWFLIRHFEREQQKQIDAARKTRELVGGADTLADLPEGFNLKEIREAIQTSAMIREERRRSGELVEAKPMRETLQAMFAQMQEVMVTSASRADPTGTWPPHIRESFEDEIGNIGIEMVNAGEAVLGNLSGGTA